MPESWLSEELMGFALKLRAKAFMKMKNWKFNMFTYFTLYVFVHQALEGPNVLELIGLPPDMQEADLGDLLMGCGNIIEMRVLRDPDTQHCIGLAYVRYG